MMPTFSGFSRDVAVAVTPGGAAGAHQIDGDLDASGDTLISVVHVSDDLVTNTDITSEFSVTGLNTISNVGGTDTTGDFLVVTYAQAIS